MENKKMGFWYFKILGIGGDKNILEQTIFYIYNNVRGGEGATWDLITKHNNSEGDELETRNRKDEFEQ